MSRRLNVWIMQTGEPLHIDKGSPRPMRAINLSNKLVEAGHNVVFGAQHLIIEVKCIERNNMRRIKLVIIWRYV